MLRSNSCWIIAGFGLRRSTLRLAECMYTGTPALKSLMSTWNVCRLSFLPPSGTAAKSSISLWPGSKPAWEADNHEPVPSHVGLCGAGTWNGFRRVRAAVASGMGTGGTRVIGCHGRDLLCLRFRSRDDSLGTRVKSVGCGE